MDSRPDDGDRRSHRERMLAGDLYDAGDPELVEDHRRALRLTEMFNGSAAGDRSGRMRVLRELLGALGPDAGIRPPFRCDYGHQITLGARSFANFGLVALDPAAIAIGEDVQIGPYVQLLTATHPIDAELRRTGLESAKPITVADNAWLGGGAIVLPGVTIGPGSVVGAGSVVTKDVPAGVLAVGNPARVVREL